jgi:hypothetical protein
MISILIYVTRFVLLASALLWLVVTALVAIGKVI